MNENNIPAPSNIAAIRDFFKSTGRPVDPREIKALSPDERQELGDLCREALEAK